MTVRKKILFYILLPVCALIGLSNINDASSGRASPFNQNTGFASMIDHTFNLFKSAAFFHISILYNKYRFGTAFSFNQIAGDACDGFSNHTRCAIQDASGSLIALNDGQKTPLFLGSIPREQSHIDALDESGLPGNKPIGIFTLNRPFEQQWAGLTDLVAENKQIVLKQYPTTDFEAPSFVDLLRIVRDLENRDGFKIGFVQCKAGRGRSATAVAAYIIHVLGTMNKETTIDQVIAYLQSKRPRVILNDSQKAVLKEFQEALKAAGSFQALYEQYKPYVEQRDAEFYPA